MPAGMAQGGMVQQGGMIQGGMIQGGMILPGMVQPGMVQPGMLQPGMVQPGMVPVGMQQRPPFQSYQPQNRLPNVQVKYFFLMLSEAKSVSHNVTFLGVAA